MAENPLLSVVLLTEGGGTRGHGHLARCTAVYDAISQLGAAPQMLVRGEAPEHILRGRNCRIADWTDPGHIAALLEPVDAALVDSYEADAAVYASVQRYARTAAYLDDTMRLSYPEGLIVNGSLAALSMRYEVEHGSQLLLGPKYQLLRRPFWTVPERPAINPRIARVLVTFGGTDTSGLLDTIAAALGDALAADLDVVDTARTAEEMRSAMLASDVAVTAAGQTLFELARTGTPSVAITVADNQVANAQAWEAAGATLVAGHSSATGIADEVVRRIRLLEDSAVRSRMSQAGFSLVDGKGSVRVARALLGRTLRERTRLIPAGPRDEVAVLALANDPAVRASALQPGPIQAQDHRSWFADVLSHPRKTMLILAWDGTTLAGQVRFDVSEGEAVVSISLAQEYRGFGWGPLLLEDGASRLANEHPEVATLVADIRRDNEVSIRLFERAGFEPAVTPGSRAQEVTYRRSVQPT